VDHVAVALALLLGERQHVLAQREGEARDAEREQHHRGDEPGRRDAARAKRGVLVVAREDAEADEGRDENGERSDLHRDRQEEGAVVADEDGPGGWWRAISSSWST
jgi:hypothetical protein